VPKQRISKAKQKTEITDQIFFELVLQPRSKYAAERERLRKKGVTYLGDEEVGNRRHRALWKEHKDQILTDWMENRNHPGSRPGAFWDWEIKPGSRYWEVGKTEAECLRDLGLLEDWEIELLDGYDKELIEQAKQHICLGGGAWCSVCGGRMPGWQDKADPWRSWGLTDLSRALQMLEKQGYKRKFKCSHRYDHTGKCRRCGQIYDNG